MPASTVAPARQPCRLYLITPAAIPDPAVFVDDLERALSGGDVAALQIRLKEAPDEEIRRAVDIWRPIAQAKGVAVILNDRPDLAVALGCDGVHVGQADTPLAEARRLMGSDAMIGVTCHDSLHLAMEAAEAGADYVAFGAFFPTRTKAVTHRADPELLRAWQDSVEIPCVAVGGVTSSNAGMLARAGADFVAVSGGVWSHSAGPAEAVREINQGLAQAF